MLAPSKRLLSEYKSIVMKMFEIFLTNLVVATNYELYYDMEIMMWLTCVLLMLEAM
jgi:hypothetical protein